jgi:inosose dehydratase
MRRREFLARGLGAAALAAQLSCAGRTMQASSRASIRFGYAAITWGDDDRRAIDDIADVGFPGIQLRASAVSEWGQRPGALKDLLSARGLTFVALSSGVVRLDPAFEAEDLALHLRHARFLRAAGGLYLQVLDERPRGRATTPDDYRRMGRLLTELGRRTADLGIPLGYHNHMGNLARLRTRSRASSKRPIRDTSGFSSTPPTGRRPAAIPQTRCAGTRTACCSCT